ncbi:solute carrier family 25 member 45 [Biomphalaria pfeifferi]|uniref:Solute carrier family 25 member 45 n=1 Tax=Biomphalaria pfeifferi TaxID=112525 RepID=A0AAD8BSD9_BIOPF|nr:solute carrier family 25 member 45 [Biomphalaria pfeifferi]
MPHTNAINDYIAGAVGGCAGVVVGHPLDTIKVQIQTQEFGGKYTNLMDCIRTVQRQTLSKGYFRGLSWPLFSYGYLNAVFFGCYGFLLKKFGCTEDLTHKKPTYWIIGVTGALATLPQVVFTCPVDVVKVSLQSQIPHYHDLPKVQVNKYFSGPLEAVTVIFRTSGIKGLYRGFLTHVVRDTPAAAMYMSSYSFFQYESSYRIPSVPSQIVNFLGGGVAGVLSWLIIMPFDVVKSKLQADACGKLYKGFWDCASQVYRADGIRAFFLGLVPMAVRAFPVNAVTLMVYSESLKYLNKIEHIDKN